MAFPPVPEPPRERGLPDLDEPTDAGLFGLWPDPFAGPPDGEDAWLGDLSLPELDALADQWAAEHGPTAGPEPVGAGFARDLPPPEAADGLANVVVLPFDGKQ